MEEFNTPERITFKHLWEMTRSVLNFERGLPFTLWLFLAYPSKATQEYLFGNRKKFMDPIKFLFLAVTIATFVLIQYIGTEDVLLKGIFENASNEEEIEIITLLSQLFTDYYNVFLFLNVPLYAIMTKLLYKKKEFYFAEHLVINTFLYASATYSTPLVLLFPESIFPTVMSIISSIISFYFIWAYKKIFDEDWLNAIWKGIVVLIVSSLFYILLLSFVLGIIAGFQLATMN